MHDRIQSLPRAVVAAALRGDDALARAAADAAAPRRRLLAALRDAHAEAMLRCAALHGLQDAARPAIPPALLQRLEREAASQLHRLETILARLPARPGAGRLRRDAASRPAGLTPLAAEERRGVVEARALRDLAHLAGHHLAARLLDLTVAERAAAAAALERCAEHGAGRHGGG
jgi:hypothetical protein